jgi:hypothetical protein
MKTPSPDQASAVPQRAASGRALRDWRRPDRIATGKGSHLHQEELFAT